MNKDSLSDQKDSIHGNYVLALKSAKRTTVNLYWNNKVDLDFIELTPGKANSLHVTPDKTLYFEMFV